MRIGLVRYGYSATGGAEAYLGRLAHGLVEAGEEVVFYTSPHWPRSAWSYGEIRRIPARSPMSFASSLAAAKKDIDCLFSLDRIRTCDVYRAGDGVQKVWLQRRAQFEPCWRHWTRFLNRKQQQILKLERCVFCPDRTGVVIANSQMVQEEILRNYHFPKERIRFIPNGFQASQSASEDRLHLRKKYGFSPEETLVLFAGTGWERKGLRFAVRAIDALQGQARLLVAGKGAAKKYSSPYTVFAGPIVSDMTSLYGAADIFLLPTLYDPFSNACLEALAAGLPVITTDANGFSELITSQDLGDRLPVGEIQGLVQALKRWLPRDVRDRTRQARLEVAKKCSMKENILKTLEAIRLSLEIRQANPRHLEML